MLVREDEATAIRPAETSVPAGTVDATSATTPEVESIAHLRVFRGESDGPSHYDEFDVPVGEGMVVLDALHWIQGNAAPDLAVRWNCKAAKCGSCSGEVNGRPKLMCKTRLSDFDLAETITVEPMRTFPLIRDLVTDVSWNYEVNKSIQGFTPPEGVPQSEWRWQQQDIERVQEFRKCIECFLCQDVCHVLRNHETERPFMGPRFLVRTAGLEMHPIDEGDRRRYLKDVGGVGYCNITKCCTEVCPEHIKITDNAIIPLKERVADEYYDPIQWAWRKLRGRPDAPAYEPLPMLPNVALGTPAPSPAASQEEQPLPTMASRSDEPMAASITEPEEQAGPPPTADDLPSPRKVAAAGKRTPRARPKRGPRRSDAGDETPSEN
ncbi:MAG TPA: succinate dehydrogenase/fumarate reductase iron-sulfur subunit [Candidatus Limnocylindrales bacterium]|nr:succinate dehydrogenase/fumarate reductase iron-sulfur subunit [Candidatus Limnocylindrales bacterium]